MYVVIVLSMCRHCDAFICNQMLRAWLIYFSYLVTVIQLYLAHCYVSGYYIVHVSSLVYIYKYPNIIWVFFFNIIRVSSPGYNYT
jgi:hypothetical protein